jgi:hypothetical protein
MSTVTIEKIQVFQTDELVERLAYSSDKRLQLNRELTDLGVSTEKLISWFPDLENLDTLKYQTAHFDLGNTQTVIPLNHTLPKQDRFISLQKWEGAVLEVKEDSFFARLIDLTDSNIDEEAEFSIEELSPEDIPLLKPGAIFYWNIGYLDKRTGQRIHASVIRFRRLPAWTSKEIKQVQDEAARLQELFEWEENEHSPKS